MRRGKEGEGWEGVAGDRVSSIGKKCNGCIQQQPTPFVIGNFHNQPIAVAFDIENDTVVCNDAGWHYKRVAVSTHASIKMLWC